VRRAAAAPSIVRRFRGSEESALARQRKVGNIKAIVVFEHGHTKRAPISHERQLGDEPTVL
jgi:hypothetical protein